MDTSLYRVTNRLTERTGWLHPLAIHYAKQGIVIFGLMLLVGWWLARRDHDLTEMARIIGTGCAAVIALGIAQLIGHAVGRARPYVTLDHVHLLVGKANDFSFPSDHATAAGAIAVGLLLARRTVGTMAVVLALGMAFTRVYVGAHYPGDVVAGLVLGGTTALGVCAFAAKFGTPLLERVCATPLGPLLVARRGDA